MRRIGGKTTSFRCSDELRERLEAHANDDDRSVGWVIRKAIEEYLDRK